MRMALKPRLLARCENEVLYPRDLLYKYSAQDALAVSVLHLRQGDIEPGENWVYLMLKFPNHLTLALPIAF